MFERTHAFLPGHFIRHYTFNHYLLLINAKNAKTVPYIGKKHDLNQVSLNVMRAHCNRQETTIKL